MREGREGKGREGKGREEGSKDLRKKKPTSYIVPT